jgi:hypothetical protein
MLKQHLQRQREREKEREREREGIQRAAKRKEVAT